MPAASARSSSAPARARRSRRGRCPPRGRRRRKRRARRARRGRSPAGREPRAAEQSRAEPAAPALGPPRAAHGDLAELFGGAAQVLLGDRRARAAAARPVRTSPICAAGEHQVGGRSEPAPASTPCRASAARSGDELEACLTARGFEHGAAVPGTARAARAHRRARSRPGAPGRRATIRIASGVRTPVDIMSMRARDRRRPGVGPAGQRASLGRASPPARPGRRWRLLRPDERRARGAAAAGAQPLYQRARARLGHCARGCSRTVVSAIENGAGIGGGVGAAHLAEHRRHLLEGGDRPVLRAQLAARPAPATRPAASSA